MKKFDIEVVKMSHGFENRKPDMVKYNTVNYRNVGNGKYRIYVGFVRQEPNCGYRPVDNGSAIIEITCNSIGRTEKKAIKEFLSIEQRVFWKDCTERAEYEDLEW